VSDCNECVLAFEVLQGSVKDLEYE
jgi:hypothetical protein